MQFSKQTKALLCALLVTTVFGSFAIAYEVRSGRELRERQVAAEARRQASFGGISLAASGAFVYDTTDHTAVFEKEADIPRPIASIVKSLTAVTALRMLGRSHIVTISQNALTPEGDNGFTAGESFRADELTKFMLVASSNDAATALAETAGSDFLEIATGTAKHLGLDQMAAYGIQSPSGLDAGPNVLHPTAVASPREVAILFDFAVRSFPDIFNATTKVAVPLRSAKGTTYTAQNTNSSLDSFKGLIASKTGTTDSGGANLVIAYRAPNNHVMIIVVLGSSAERRFADTLELVRRTNMYLSIQP